MTKWSIHIGLHQIVTVGDRIRYKIFQYRVAQTSEICVEDPFCGGK